MPVITFWSNNEKTIGQTISAAVAATVMAIEYNYKVLLISADFNNNVIEKCFGAQESNQEIIKKLVQKEQVNLESGIKGLYKLADSNRVTPEVIHDYTKIIFKNRLEAIYSSMNVVDKEKEQELIKKMKNIILNASRYYDYLFIDLKKGIQYEEQEKILDLSDVIVVNVDQNIENIEEAIKFTEQQKNKNKFIWNICRYDKASKYNDKNLIRNILKRKVVCKTDYNTLIFDAAQEGNIAELLIRFRTLKKDEKTQEFYNNIKKTIEEILSKYKRVQTGM